MREQGLAPPDHAGLTPRERMLRALRFQEVDRPPVWFMRQAGRYLPEYRSIRSALPFEQRLSSPEVAAELTLQPLRRFALDAAVLFSDILVPLPAMGHAVSFTDAGPRIAAPVRSPEHVEAIRVPDPARDFPFVGQALQRVRESLPGHAVLGFAGAPFTLAAYLVEGGGAKDFAETKRFAHTHPDAWKVLMDRLAETVARHLEHQVRCGADAVQVFDTWAELLSPEDYAALAVPWTQAVFRRLREERSVPAIHFARGTAHLLPLLGETGADAYGVDWRVGMDAVRSQYPRVPLQGNLDPTLLFAPPAVVARRTREILDSLQGQGHVFNLGHGVLPGTPLEGVQAMVDTVTSWRP